MNRVVSLTVLLLLGFIASSHADTGHDLLKKCEASVVLQNFDELQKQLDELIVKESDGNFGKEEIDKLKEILLDTRRLQAAQCISYLSGFGGADSLSPLTRKGRRMFCIPKNISLYQAASLTVEWMRKNKDKLHYGAHEVLAMSNIVNFPCPRT